MQYAITFVEMFRKLLNGPAAEQRAQRDLEKARIALLEHQSATEFHSKMTEYYETVIKRLSKYR